MDQFWNDQRVENETLTNGLVSSTVDPGNGDHGEPLGDGHVAGQDYCRRRTFSIVG